MNLTQTPSWYWFSLPLNSWQLVLVSIVLLSFFLSKFKSRVGLLVIAFVFLRTLSVFVGEQPSFQTCLQLHLPDPKCTPFYQKDATIENKLTEIKFSGDNFPLYGFNQYEFNRVGEEAGSRPYLPFSMTVVFPDAFQKDSLLIESSPSVVFQDNGFTYSSNNDFHNNYLEVNFEKDHDSLKNIAKTLLNVVSLLILLTIIYKLKPTWSWTYLPLLMLSAWGTLLPVDLVLPFYLVFAKSKKHFWSLGVCVVIFAAQAANRYGCYSCQTILPGGSDPLTYEGFARDIIFNNAFWSAGEPGVAFYYTPLYRYFLALFHFLGGESLWPVRFFSNLIYLSTLITVSNIFLKFFRRSVTLLSLLLLSLLNKLPQLGLYFVFKDYYSESIGLPLLLLSIYLLLIKPTRSHYAFVGALTLSLSIGVRPNYLFAAAPLFLYTLIRAKRKLMVSISFVLGAIPPIAFILVRNLIEVGRVQYFNTSGASTLALGLVDLFYHGQSVAAPQSIYFQIVEQTFIDPQSTLIPLLNNFMIMLGIPSYLPQSLSFLPVYGAIPNSLVYLPVWLIGIPGLILKLRTANKSALLPYISVFGLIFLSSLPFGVYFNGSAKYYLYILFLMPFAVDLTFNLATRLVSYLRYHNQR